MRPLRASLPDEQQPIRPHAHAANMGVCRFRRTLPIRLRAAYTQRTSLANRNLVTAIGPGRSSVVTNPDRDPWRVRRSPSYGYQARRTHTRSRKIHRASPPTSLARRPRSNLTGLSSEPAPSLPFPGSSSRQPQTQRNPQQQPHALHPPQVVTCVTRMRKQDRSTWHVSPPPNPPPQTLMNG